MTLQVLPVYKVTANPQIETKSGSKGEQADMAIVLISDTTLMPSLAISIPPFMDNSSDSDVVSDILQNFELQKMKTDKTSTKKSYVNSLIAEVKVENAPDDFKLNLYLRPTIDIVSRNIKQCVVQVYGIQIFYTYIYSNFGY